MFISLWFLLWPTSDLSIWTPSGSPQLVCDSLQFGGDNVDTQLLSSPSSLMNTDIAQATLKSVNEKEDAAQVPNRFIARYDHTTLYYSI